MKNNQAVYSPGGILQAKKRDEKGEGNFIRKGIVRKHSPLVKIRFKIQELTDKATTVCVVRNDNGAMPIPKFQGLRFNVQNSENLKRRTFSDVVSQVFLYCMATLE